ncbi:WGR domain-containing protein [Paracidovorax cattleyae]|uniref:WGR domain-containing protein, predicted DNA-binding domain in MolR n=1 Tax=Paracidovorax cattleyae TaxID=80868 RepID=A0A1H0T8V0_9BURK|nr:WGR domain-containing protein [Paracidovorax cattleyae]SDP50493.1 WGR domain-containing protein, predicted DNA-binding domain in MolR [Paracidovorax cattleyae]
MRRFELIEGNSSKFWEVEQAASDLNIRWGRIGTAGQSQTKPCADAAKASAAPTRLVAEKTGKGYAEKSVSRRARRSAHRRRNPRR